MKKLIIKKKKEKKKISPKVMFYTFLIMSLGVIWLGAYSVNNHTTPLSEKPVSKEKDQPEIKDPSYEVIPPDSDKQAEETIIKQIEETFETPKTDERISLPSPDDNEKQVVSYIKLPVAGEITKHFSDSELIYSETMADYRTHPGVDILSTIGADIYSPQNGKITEISKDDELGYSITIDHGNMISRISNLSSKIDLKVGDKVNIGQKIAICGDSADYEIADKPHIHYELKINGINVNPLEYVE